VTLQKFIALPILTMLFFTVANAKTVYTCDLIVGTSIDMKKTVFGGKKQLVARADNNPKSFSVSIIEENGKTRIQGNAGVSSLQMVGKNKTSGQVYYIERTLSGNVFLWTLHPIKKHINDPNGKDINVIMTNDAFLIQQKTYNIMGPLTYTNAYFCEKN